MNFTAITCVRAKKELGSAPRPYGYTLALNPPKELIHDGQDVEGIDWVPCVPYEIIQRWQGWYKYKSDAVARANALNKII